jgi:hypothetical protein
VHVFIAGIMQGSRRDTGIDAQDYRHRITVILQRHVPGIEVLDPFALHPDSVTYGPDRAKQTLLELATLAGRADALIAYAPSASMGTAIEIWNAYQNGVPVYTISPLVKNWVISSLSTRVFPDIAAFEAFVVDGGLSGPGA